MNGKEQRGLRVGSVVVYRTVIQSVMDWNTSDEY